MVNKIQHKISNDISKPRIFTSGWRRIEAETDNYKIRKNKIFMQKKKSHIY